VRANTLIQSPPTGAASLTPAICEDGSEPARQANGSRACADGSEALCEDGSRPTRTGAAGVPLCPIATTAAATGASECEDGTATPCSSTTEGPTETGPAGCEDGSAATPTGSGTYSCRPDVAPSCLEGYSPTFATDGMSFVCEREG
jgi:hypothetical protein